MQVRIEAHTEVQQSPIRTTVQLIEKLFEIFNLKIAYAA